MVFIDRMVGWVVRNDEEKYCTKSVVQMLHVLNRMSTAKILS